MALLAKLQRSSRRHYVAALLLFSLFLILIGQFQVLPLLFVGSVPVLLFSRYVLHLQQHISIADEEIEQLVRIFLGGFFVNSLLALVLESILSSMLVVLCFYDQRSSIQDQIQKYRNAPHNDQSVKLGKTLMSLKIDKTVGYYLFLVGIAFIVAGLVEEYLKYWIVQGTCCCGSSRRRCCIFRLFRCCKGKSESVPAFTALKQRQQRHNGRRGMMCHPSRLLFLHRPHANHAYVVLLSVIAGALGFSVAENVAFTLVAHTFRDKLEVAASRGIIGALLHCICGGITGVRMVEQILAHRGNGSEQQGNNVVKADLKRWSTKISILFPAVFIHGMFDMLQFLLMMLVTDKMEAAHPTFYRIILPGILFTVLIHASYMYLRRKLHVMEAKVNETQYMHLAVELESGQRPGAVNGGLDLEKDFFGHDDNDSEDEDERFAQGSDRKVRSVFNT